ncbi:hypothetical protein Barb7_03133 [Bacteroidales bacterium Barb7]|nr:hypothetical protein Barb7_03133 [Bacteroidales bacterium Barb7]
MQVNARFLFRSNVSKQYGVCLPAAGKALYNVLCRFFGEPLLHIRVPFAAGGTFPDPFGGIRTAVGAEIDGFCFGYCHLCLVGV